MPHVVTAVRMFAFFVLLYASFFPIHLLYSPFSLLPTTVIGLHFYREKTSALCSLVGCSCLIRATQARGWRSQDLGVAQGVPSLSGPASGSTPRTALLSS